MSLKIRKPFDPLCRGALKVYSRKEKVYRLKRDEHYNSEYVEVGECDIPDDIESYVNGCSLKSIIDRCSLMPVHDKVRYLQQREDGLSADVSSMPKDGVEAFMLLDQYKRSHPDIFERVSKGESLDAVLASIGQSAVSDSADAKVQFDENTQKGEVKSDG